MSTNINQNWIAHYRNAVNGTGLVVHFQEGIWIIPILQTLEKLHIIISFHFGLP